MTTITAGTPTETKGTVPLWATVIFGVASLLQLVLAMVAVLECIDVLSEDPGFSRQFDYFWWHTHPNTDTTILILAISAGVVGSFIMAGTSYVKYIGNQKLRRWWLPFYVVRAPIGAALAVIIYLVFRAGLIPSSSASDAVSPWGVAALAGLAGMFSNRAVEQLEEVFNAAFAKDDQSSDKLIGGPRINGVKWEGNPPEPLQLVLRGSDFDEEMLIVIDDHVVTPFTIEADRIAIDTANVPNSGRSRDGDPLVVFVQGKAGKSNPLNIPERP